MQEEVFQNLVEAHYAPLFRFALSLTRSSADASDLTQQTFFIWATKGETLREAGKAKSWLFTTLYREFVRGRRRNARITAIEDLPPPEQDVPDLEVEKIENLDAELLMEALQECEPTYREPLTLFYLQDLSYLEIAGILDIPIGTVMSRLSRGKAHLRARVAEKTKGATVIDFVQGTKRA